MLYIFLSICCSVTVSVMLKLARRYEIDVYQAITWNYSAAILLSLVFFHPHIPSLDSAPVVTYSVLGLLLPTIFMMLALAVRYTGIVRTEVAQRMSLLISLAAAFWLFNELYSPLKITGLAIGLVAIAFCIPWHKNNQRNEASAAASFVYLALVFIGFGLIDIFFREISVDKTVPFTTSLFIVFIISFVIAMIGLVFLIATGKTRFSWPHIFFGWVLGVVNFANIFFYLKAHQALAQKPSAVFSGVNLGVIIVGMLVGVIVFKEKLTLLNKIGIALALASVIIITISQHAV